ncbi:MAG: hypothetical protein HY928_14945 [Elusimicrobia bacterium]|nr:hypothetical protein [Elusimicrobiota bacterium]
MTLKNRLSLAALAVLAALPAAAQMMTGVRVAPVNPGPALTGAAVAGLKAPALANPVLPSVSLTPTLPAASVLPRADAVAMPVPGVRAWPRSHGVGLAAPAEANAVAEKPVAAALEAAAKPFADEKGRSSAEASGRLKAVFEGSRLQAADEPAAVVPGVRSWPRVAGVGLARPFNGVSEEKKAEAPAPKKADPEKPMKRWEAVLTGVLLAACLAGSLYSWYLLYDSMAHVMYNAAPSIEQQYPYYGPVGGWEDLFGR